MHPGILGMLPSPGSVLVAGLSGYQTSAAADACRRRQPGSGARRAVRWAGLPGGEALSPACGRLERLTRRRAFPAASATPSSAPVATPAGRTGVGDAPNRRHRRGGPISPGRAGHGHAGRGGAGLGCAGACRLRRGAGLRRLARPGRPEACHRFAVLASVIPVALPHTLPLPPAVPAAPGPCRPWLPWRLCTSLAAAPGRGAPCWCSTPTSRETSTPRLVAALPRTVSRRTPQAVRKPTALAGHLHRARARVTSATWCLARSLARHSRAAAAAPGRGWLSSSTMSMKSITMIPPDVAQP